MAGNLGGQFDFDFDSLPDLKAGGAAAPSNEYDFDSLPDLGGGVAKDPSLGARVARGAQSTIDYGRIAATNDPSAVARIVAENQRAALPQSRAGAAMAEEIKPYQQAYEQSSGLDAVGKFASMAAKRISQLAGNPREFAGMMAENLPNSAPGLAGNLAGAAVGGMAAGPVGAIAGSVAGGTAGGYAIEQGASMLEQIVKEARLRGVDTRDEAALTPIVVEKYNEFLSASRKKGIGTAGTDAALNALTFGVAGAAERTLAKEAGNLGASVKAGSVPAAEAAQSLAAIEAKQAARMTTPARLKRGAGITGAEMGGESLSEAAGQALAYGEVDPLDVIDEGLLGAGQGAAMAAGRGAVSRVLGIDERNAVEGAIADAREAIETPDEPKLSTGFVAQAFTDVAGAGETIDEMGRARGAIALSLSKMNDEEANQAISVLSGGDEALGQQLMAARQDPELISVGRQMLSQDAEPGAWDAYTRVNALIRRDTGLLDTSSVQPTVAQLSEGLEQWFPTLFQGPVQGPAQTELGQPQAEFGQQQPGMVQPGGLPLNSAGFVPEPPAQVAAQIQAVREGRKPLAAIGLEEAQTQDISGLAQGIAVGLDGRQALVLAPTNEQVQSVVTKAAEVGLEQALGEALGYVDPTMTTQIGRPTAVVQQIDQNTGQVIQDELVTPEQAGEVVRLPGTETRVLPVQQALMERQQKLAEATPVQPMVQPQAPVEPTPPVAQQLSQPIEAPAPSVTAVPKAPTAVGDLISRLNSANMLEGGASLDESSIREVDLKRVADKGERRRLGQLQQAAKSAFGVDLVWVDAPTGALMRKDGTEFAAFNGFADRASGRVFVSRKAATPMNTLAHELAHIMETQAPEIYAQAEEVILSRVSMPAYLGLRNALKSAVEAESKGSKDAQAVMAEFRSEIIAETIGQMGQDTTMWSDVFSSLQSPEQAKTLYDRVISTIKKMAQALTRVGYIEGIKDMKAVSKAVTDAFVEWSIKSPKPAAAPAAQNATAPASVKPAETSPPRPVPAAVAPTKTDDLARQKGESDKDFAKRVVDKRPKPKSLPENHGSYFTLPAGTVIAPIDKIASTKSDAENEQGAENGVKRMAAAAAGELSKRAPITVMPSETVEGGYDIVDGNGTYSSVKAYGWKTLPVVVVTRKKGKRAIKIDKAKELAEKHLPKSLVKEVVSAVENFEDVPDDPAFLAKKAEAEAFMEPLLAKAAEANKDYQAGVLKLAEDLGAQAKSGPLKKMDRSAYKLWEDSWRNGIEPRADMIKDLSRASIVLDTPEAAQAAIEEVKKRFNVIRVKDRFASPLDTGYRDILVNVKLPNGTIAEMQLHVQEIFDVKELGHIAYEAERQLQDGTQAKADMKALELKYYEAAYGLALGRASRLATQASNSSGVAGNPSLTTRPSETGLPETTSKNSPVLKEPITGISSTSSSETPPLANSALQSIAATSNTSEDSVLHKGSGTYISRPVLNGEALHAWAKAVGIQNVVPANKMHVTLAYSKTPIGKDAVSAKIHPVIVGQGGRSVEQFDDGSVVLRISSDQLQARWKELVDAGATWDFGHYKGAYKPHVTLSYEKQDIDTAKMTPPDGPVVLGGEKVEPLRTNYSDEIKAEIEKKAGPPLIAFSRKDIVRAIKGDFTVNPMEFLGAPTDPMLRYGILGRNLPVAITPQVIHKIGTGKDEGRGSLRTPLTPEQIESLPKYVQTPAAVFDDPTEKDSLTFMTSMVMDDTDPVVVAIAKRPVNSRLPVKMIGGALRKTAFNHVNTAHQKEWDAFKVWINRDGALKMVDPAQIEAAVNNGMPKRLARSLREAALNSKGRVFVVGGSEALDRIAYAPPAVGGSVKQQSGEPPSTTAKPTVSLPAGSVNPLTGKKILGVKKPEAVSLSRIYVQADEAPTRYPTGKKFSGDKASGQLYADYAAAQADPGYFAKITGMMSSFTGLRGETAEATAEANIEFFKRNILFLYDKAMQADAKAYAMAKQWYIGGNRIAKQFAQQWGIQPRQAAAMIAVTSASMDWFQNVENARLLGEFLHKKPAINWSGPVADEWGRQMNAATASGDQDKIALLTGIRNKQVGSVSSPLEKAQLFDLHTRASGPLTFRIITPNGDFLGPKMVGSGAQARRATGMLQTVDNLAKAAKAFMVSDKASISEALGGGHKIRNFYNNLISPDSPNGFTTIDTHAVAVAHMNAMSGVSPIVKANFSGPKSANTGLKGTYPLYHEAYTRAAAERGVMPREMQSITWEAGRILFDNKRPFGVPETMTGPGYDIWSQFQRGEIDEQTARERVAGLGPAIVAPEWAVGPNSGVAAGERPAGDAQGVAVNSPPGGQEPGRTGRRAAGKRAGVPPPGVVASRQALSAAEDSANQLRWLDEQAKSRGYKDLDDMAEKDIDAITELSAQWRQSHPADILLSRAQTQTPEFKRWFGNSKVVDEDGRPRVVYHGTAADFTAFDPGRIGETYGIESHKGFFFTGRIETAESAADDATKLPTYMEKYRYRGFGGRDERDYADDFDSDEPYDMTAIYNGGQNIMPVYLSLQNPLEVTAGMGYGAGSWLEGGASGDLIQQARDGGHDGLIIYGRYRNYEQKNRINARRGDRISDEDADRYIAELDAEDLRKQRGDVYFVAFKPEQIKSAIGNRGTFDPASADIRFSRPLKALTAQDIINGANPTYRLADAIERAQWAEAMRLAKSQGERQQLLARMGDWVIETFADAMIAARRWIDSLPLSTVLKQRMAGDLYRAATVRAGLQKEVKNQFTEPLFRAIEAASKKTGLSSDQVKAKAGYWMTAKYVPKANAHLVAKDQVVLQAALRSGDQQAIAQAQQNLNDRMADVNGAIGAPRKRGVAGGLNNAEAAAAVAKLESEIPRQLLDEIAKPVYEMLAWKKAKDLSSGKVSQLMVNSWPNHRDYVPLTGDPRFDPETDDIFSAGSQLNQEKDYAMNGRKDSVADDAIHAAYEATLKSINFAAMQDFKRSLAKAHDEARSAGVDIGLTREPVTGIVRTGDDVVIYRDTVTAPNGLQSQRVDAFRFKDNRVIQALKRENEEDLNRALKMIATPTRWYGKLVTQFMPAFAPVNMIRDLWERSELVRTRKLVAANGSAIDTDKVANRAIAQAINPQLWKASIAYNSERPINTPEYKDLAELIKLGGSSVWGEYLSRTSSDLEADLRRSYGRVSSAWRTTNKIVEGYNNAFEMIAPLAIYTGLKQQGMEPKAAAAAVLDLMNFKKRGVAMPAVKALYVFAQPAATSGYNLAQYLSTKKGRVRFVAQLLAGLALYSLLKGLWGDEEDEELGNRLDNLSNFTVERSIPIPIGDKVLKVPVGFGAPQLAWAGAATLSRWASGRYDTPGALGELAKSWAKSVSPVAPSEMEIAKNPGLWLLQTFTPTIAKPLMSIGTDRTAMGQPLKPQFIDADKWKSDQAKRSTPEFYKEVATDLRETLGIDVFPDHIKAMVDGWLVGPARMIVQAAIDNPAREERGEKGTLVGVSQLLDNVNDRRILDSIYYRFREQAEQSNREYESRLRDGRLTEWMTPERMSQVVAYKEMEKVERQLGSMRGKLTKLGDSIDPDQKSAYIQQIEEQSDRSRRELLKRFVPAIREASP